MARSFANKYHGGTQTPQLISELGKAFLNFQGTKGQRQAIEDRLNDLQATTDRANTSRQAELDASMRLTPSLISESPAPQAVGVGSMFNPTPLDTDSFNAPGALDIQSPSAMMEAINEITPPALPSTSLPQGSIDEQFRPTEVYTDPVSEGQALADKPSDVQGLMNELIRGMNQKGISAPDSAKIIQGIVDASASQSDSPEVRGMTTAAKATATDTAKLDRASARKIKEQAALENGKFAQSVALKRVQSALEIEEYGKKIDTDRKKGVAVSAPDMKIYREMSEEALDDYSFTVDVQSNILAEMETLIAHGESSPHKAFLNAIRNVTEVDPSMLGKDDLVLTEATKIKNFRHGTLFKSYGTDPKTGKRKLVNKVRYIGADSEGNPIDGMIPEAQFDRLEKLRTGWVAPKKGRGKHEGTAAGEVINHLETFVGDMPELPEMENPREGLSKVIRNIAFSPTAKRHKKEYQASAEKKYDKATAEPLKKLKESVNDEYLKVVKSKLSYDEKVEVLRPLWNKFEEQLSRIGVSSDGQLEHLKNFAYPEVENTI